MSLGGAARSPAIPISPSRDLVSSGPNATAVEPARTGRTRWRVVVGLAYLSVFLVAKFWQGQVNKHVPEPYLDEVFHIPQAQRYCNGDRTWDPKITTPPGLYWISLLLQRINPFASCTASGLRSIGWMALLLILQDAGSCRTRIGQRLTGRKSQPTDEPGSAVSSFALHTAVNICLFPPLFFFSGLYYTDVVSTWIVIGAYNYLQDQLDDGPSFLSGVSAWIYGIAALVMRQTNIFWVALFLAGVQWLKAVDVNFSARTSTQTKLTQLFNDVLGPRPTSALLDPPLRSASITDVVSSIIRLGVEVFASPVTFIEYMWPYIGLLFSFALFVLCNGGVVLGDKSNHVAVLHLPQLLYLSAFMAFFSLPVIYPFALAIIKGLGDGLLMKKDPSNTSFARRSGVRLYHVPYLILATLFGLAIIHYNTIIHPFTLADNRHYIFYIFRYSIRRNEIAKYTLAPVYVACGYVLFLTFGGLRSLQTQPSATAITAKSQAIQKKSDDKVTQIQAVEAQGNGAVFTVIWFGASALSLITAPLVEPRYFIIPWVIWRLNLPPLPVSAKAAVAGKCDRKETSWIDSLKYWAYEGHDHRLWLETAWFLLINVVTGYVFLFRGFEWPSEPGLVQRFMW